jgi:hypothetical protein
MLFIARGIEDDHFWVVREIDGTLVETPRRIEHVHDGYRLSHADDAAETSALYGLGPFATPEDAAAALPDD